MSDPRDIRDETLAQFGMLLDEHAGKPVDFVDTVIGLRNARYQISAISARRTEIYGVVKEHYRRGQTGFITPSSAWRIKAQNPPKVTTIRTVSAADVKRRSTALWAVCRVPVPRIHVDAPEGVEDPVIRVVLPGVPSGRSLHDTLNAYKHPVFDETLNTLRERERSSIDQLKYIAEIMEWDGMPITFRDGWTAGLCRLEFSADELKKRDPATWEKLAVTKTRGGGEPVLRVVEASAKDGDIDVDGD